uniref:Organic solute transporter subunit alpha-like n=3 Tax=Hirondellea gigas TaxID=1518452 RepID=A0A6A7G946_9CRUS
MESISPSAMSSPFVSDSTGVPPTGVGVGYTEPHINSSQFFRRYPEDVMRATTCTDAVREFQPTNDQFMEILGPAGYVMVAGATLAMFLLLVLFLETVIRVHKILIPEHKFPVSIILSVYPVLGLCSFLGILFPKANALMDAASQLWFALCMLQFFKLTILYYGGETAFVESLHGKVLPWRGPPCCCWPCCWPLCPKTPVSKGQIKLIRILVLQHPFVQSIMTIIGISLWVEGYYKVGDFSLTKGYVYIFAITTVSFMFGLWAFIVGFKASIPQLRKYHYGKKILTFQLCLIFLRFQSLIFGLILLPSGAIPCVPPISPSVYANTILCCLLIGQLVILSVLARHFYTLPPMEDKELGKLEPPIEATASSMDGNHTFVPLVVQDQSSEYNLHDDDAL